MINDTSLKLWLPTVTEPYTYIIHYSIYSLVPFHLIKFRLIKQHYYIHIQYCTIYIIHHSRVFICQNPKIYIYKYCSSFFITSKERTTLLPGQSYSFVHSAGKKFDTWRQIVWRDLYMCETRGGRKLGLFFTFRERFC